ncbi:MAG: AI-2E family transporter [Gammaproteobacteria bacterium]|nr:AI-2E family transporter [Gammaproteobacteria bacterium]
MILRTIFNHPIGRALIIYVGIILMLTVLVLLLKPVLIPLIIAFILFSILDPLKNRLMRSGLNAISSIIIVLMAVVAIGVVCLVIGIPLMLDQWEWLQTRLPTIATQVAKILDGLGASLINAMGMQVDTRLGERWLTDLKSQSTDAVVSSAGIMVQSVFALVFIPLITFFLLRDYRKMRNTAMSWLPNKAYELGWLIYFRVAKKLQNYIRSVFMQSAIIAMVTVTGFYLIGLDTAVLFGVLAGFLNLIPYVGPLLSMLPPMLVALGSSTPDIWLLVSIAAVVLTAQLIDNIFVIPSLIASTVDLHPMLVLLGVVVFGYFFGFIGMLVAIPVLATSKIILKGLVNGLNRGTSEDMMYAVPIKRDTQKA